MLLNALSFSAAYVSKTLMFFSPGTQTYLHFSGREERAPETYSYSALSLPKRSLLRRSASYAQPYIAA